MGGDGTEVTEEHEKRGLGSVMTLTSVSGDGIWTSHDTVR